MNLPPIFFVNISCKAAFLHKSYPQKLLMMIKHNEGRSIMTKLPPIVIDGWTPKKDEENLKLWWNLYDLMIYEESMRNHDENKDIWTHPSELCSSMCFETRLSTLRWLAGPAHPLRRSAEPFSLTARTSAADSIDYLKRMKNMDEGGSMGAGSWCSSYLRKGQDFSLKLKIVLTCLLFDWALFVFGLMGTISFRCDNNWCWGVELGFMKAVCCGCGCIDWTWL